MYRDFLEMRIWVPFQKKKAITHQRKCNQAPHAGLEFQIDKISKKKPPSYSGENSGYGEPGGVIGIIFLAEGDFDHPVQTTVNVLFL